jgi:hypothetical protein
MFCAEFSTLPLNANNLSLASQVHICLSVESNRAIKALAGMGVLALETWKLGTKGAEACPLILLGAGKPLTAVTAKSLSRDRQKFTPPASGLFLGIPMGDFLVRN